MLTYDDLKKLEGMKHIRYQNTEQDAAWQFMLRVSANLIKENQELKDQIAMMKDQKCKKQDS